MIFAAPGETGSDIILFLHILTAMAAFAPVFLHPALRGGLSIDGLWGSKIYAPALILTGILGFGAAGMSDDVYSLGDGWLIAAIIVWIAQNGVLHALVVPGEKAWSVGDHSGAKKVSTGSAVIAGLLVVQLILMVFKPGA